LAPACLLDFLRFFVLFEDDGTLVKKTAGYHQFHAVRSTITQVAVTRVVWSGIRKAQARISP
jgi:type I site-specific restriction-modification system R (restriction) subunit